MNAAAIGKRKRRVGNLLRVLGICALNVLVVLLCTVVFSPRPENNDDFILHSVLGGAFGEPSPYVGIVNIYLAKLVCALQNTWPALNWFSVLLYAGLCAAFCAAGSCLWLARPDAVGGCIAAAFCVFVSVPMYLSLQYTKFAIFIAAAGCMTILFGVYRRFRPGAVAAGTVLCLFGGMMRIQSFAAGAACALLPALYVLFSASRRGKFGKWLKANAALIGSYAVMLALVAGFYGAHQAAYAADPQAAYYQRYLAAQQRVTDYPLRAFEDEWESYEALGVSQNDLQMIEDWSFADSEKFTAELLETIAQVGGGGNETVFQRFGQGVSLFTVTKSAAWFCLAVWMLGMLLADRPTKLRLSGILLAYFVLLFVLAATGRVTRWVCLGLLTGTCLAAAWCLTSGHIRIRKPLALAGSAALLAVCLVFTAFTLPKTTEKPDPSELLEIYDRIAEEDDTLYLADMSSMPSLFERLSVFESVPRGLYTNLFELGGWHTETPARNTVLARFGVEGSPYRALFEREDVFLIDTMHFDTKAAYLRENYSKTACWSLYDNIGGLFVYAASETPSYRLEEGVEIEEVTQEPCALNPSWTTWNIAVQTEETGLQTVWVSFEKKGEPSMTYRARILQAEDGKILLTFAVSPLDQIDLNDRSVRVLLSTQDGVLGSGEAYEISEEKTENDD